MPAWTSWKRRVGIVAAVVAVLSTGLFVDARADGPPVPRCGPNDLPETGLQGDVPKADQLSGRAEQGYNCGLALVGHTELNADGRDGSPNANMAWSQHCAYVAGPGTTFGPTLYDAETDDPNGVAVVDVSDPTSPTHVRTLTGRPASTKTSETIFAIDAPARNGYPARHVLVVGQYGNAGSGVLKPMDIYDVSDCADPVLLTTYEWQENIHNLTISGNGRYVFATQPLQMIDIDPLFDTPRGEPTYLGDIERDMPYPLVPVNPGPTVDDDLPADLREASRNGYSAHQAWSSFDGTRLHLGAQTPQFDVFTIVDIEEWLNSRVGDTIIHTTRPKVLRQTYGRGHSVSVAKIGGEEWALHAEESVFGMADDCGDAQKAWLNVSPQYGLTPFVGVAEPFLSNVSNPSDTNPDLMHVSRLGLEINRQENCGAKEDDPDASHVQASVHYHDFDNTEDANFAILSMQNAGIRVWDVRNPAEPKEVAYFNPGDVGTVDDPTTPENEDTLVLDTAWAHSRYVPETGHIWFATRAGGFWVVELEPQVRGYFRLGVPTPPLHPSGTPGRTRIVTSAAALPLDLDPGYCTVGRRPV